MYSILFRYHWLKGFVIALLMLLPVVSSLSQGEESLHFGDKVGFVVILECSVNDEVIASIAQQVINEEPTDIFSVTTAFSPDVEYFNSAGLTEVSIHERFTQICSEGLTGGKIMRMKE